MNRSFNKFSTALLLMVTLAGGSLVLSSCTSNKQTESTGEYIDDSVITTKVKAAIFNDESLKVLEINVETFKGVVQLSGFVSSQADIDRAVSVARSIKGVRSVENDMVVK